MWPGTVVTDDLWMLLAEIRIKIVLSEVCKKLDPPTLCHIFTEMYHAVQVVCVSGFGLVVAFFVHWSDIMKALLQHYNGN